MTSLLVVTRKNVGR